MRPYINELYDRIEKDTGLKNSVKIIGIAVGNNSKDIAFVEKKYNFPIVPDKKFAFHRLIGQPPTPLFIFARPYGDGRLLVLNSHLGRLEDTDRLFAMVNTAIKKSIPGSFAEREKRSGEKVQDGLLIPVEDSELAELIGQSLVENGEQAEEIKKISSTGLGDLYTGVLKKSHRRIFARVVARKIPCVDCHDVFFIYSFDEVGRFIRFIPISISKLDNEDWDEKDILKIQNSFKETSLLSEREFQPEVDGISSATISSQVIYHSMSETEHVIRRLRDMRYIR